MEAKNKKYKSSLIKQIKSEGISPKTCDIYVKLGNSALKIT